MGVGGEQKLSVDAFNYTQIGLLFCFRPFPSSAKKGEVLPPVLTSEICFHLAAGESLAFFLGPENPLWEKWKWLQIWQGCFFFKILIFFSYVFIWLPLVLILACGIFPGRSDSKESACTAGDPGSVPRSGGSPGKGNGNPFQYSCLENAMDRGAWWATVHGVTKSRTGLSD